MSWESVYKGKRAGGAEVVVSFRECCGNMEGTADGDGSRAPARSDMDRGGEEGVAAGSSIIENDGVTPISLVPSGLERNCAGSDDWMTMSRE